MHLRLLLGSSLLPVARGSLQTLLSHSLFPSHKCKALSLLAGWVVGGLQALLRYSLVSLALLRLPLIHLYEIVTDQWPNLPKLLLNGHVWNFYCRPWYLFIEPYKLAGSGRGWWWCTLGEVSQRA